MRFEIDITLAHPSDPTLDFGCGAWYVGFGIYSRYKILKITDTDKDAAILAILSPPLSLVFRGTLDVVVDAENYLWFGGYGLITQQIETYIVPYLIRGTIKCRYIA